MTLNYQEAGLSLEKGASHFWKKCWVQKGDKANTKRDLQRSKTTTKKHVRNDLKLMRRIRVRNDLKLPSTCEVRNDLKLRWRISYASGIKSRIKNIKAEFRRLDCAYQHVQTSLRGTWQPTLTLATFHLLQTSEMSSKSDIIVMAVVVTFFGLAYVGLYTFYFGRFIGPQWLEVITSPAVVANRSRRLHQTDPHPEVYELSTLRHSRSPLQFLRPTSWPVTNMDCHTPPIQSSCQSTYLPSTSTITLDGLEVSGDELAELPAEQGSSTTVNISSRLESEA